MKRYDTEDGTLYVHKDVYIQKIKNRHGWWSVEWNGDDVQREEVRTLARAKCRARAIAKWDDCLKQMTIPGGLWSEEAIKEHYPKMWKTIYGGAS